MASFDQYIDVRTGEELWATYFRGYTYCLEPSFSPRIIQAAAWCHDCFSVVSAEHLPTETEIQTERESLHAAIRGEKSSSSYFYRTPEAAREALEERERFWTAMAKRKSLSRCLSCFCTNILPLTAELDEDIQIPNGPVLRYTTFGFADCGIEPKLQLDLEGLPMDRPNGGEQ